MDFVIVLLLLLAVRYWWGELPVFGTGLVDRWFAWVERYLAGVPAYLVTVVLPVLVLGWVSVSSASIGFGLLGLILHVAVLLWVIRAPSPEFVFDQLHVDSRQAEGAPELGAVQRRLQLRQLLAGLHEDFFVYVLWYLLLGPAGPVFCYLQRRYEQSLRRPVDPIIAPQDADHQKNREQFSPWLIGLSVRLSLLVLAVVGNFREGWRYFLDSLKDWTLDVGDLLHTGFELALESSEGEASESESSSRWLDQYEKLLSRLFFGWMGVAALLMLLS